MVRTASESELWLFAAIDLFLYWRIRQLFPDAILEQKHLIWALGFLKTYSNEIVLARLFQTSEKTLRKYVHLVVGCSVKSKWFVRLTSVF